MRTGKAVVFLFPAGFTFPSEQLFLKLSATVLTEPLRSSVRLELFLLLDLLQAFLLLPRFFLDLTNVFSVRPEDRRAFVQLIRAVSVRGIAAKHTVFAESSEFEGTRIDRDHILQGINEITLCLLASPTADAALRRDHRAVCLEKYRAVGAFSNRHDILCRNRRFFELRDIRQNRTILFQRGKTPGIVCKDCQDPFLAGEAFPQFVGNIARSADNDRTVFPKPSSEILLADDIHDFSPGGYALDSVIVARRRCDAMSVLKKADHLITDRAGGQFFHVPPFSAGVQAVFLLPVRIDIRQLDPSVGIKTDNALTQTDDLPEVMHSSDDAANMIFVVIDPRRAVRHHISIVEISEEEEICCRPAVLHPLPDHRILRLKLFFLFLHLPVDFFFLVFRQAFYEVPGFTFDLSPVVRRFALFFRCQTLVFAQLFTPAGFRFSLIGQRIVLSLPIPLGVKTFRPGEVFCFDELAQVESVKLRGVIVLYS